jgi:hypothetical protein
VAVAEDAVPSGDNSTLIAAFEELAPYEAKRNKHAPFTYGRIVKAIREHGRVITAGADVAKAVGVGPKTVADIDELLMTGKLAQLEKHKATRGPVPVAAPMSEATAAEVAARKAQLVGTATVARLKVTLQANGQATTGAKDELARRCAEGAVMGRIPKCPACKDGMLRYDATSGVYACPGFHDPDSNKFRHCRFKAPAVTRAPWVHPAEAVADH